MRKRENCPAAENVVGTCSDIYYSLLTIYAFQWLLSIHDNTKYTASSSLI
jgi:hypothetical protein